MPCKSVARLRGGSRAGLKRWLKQRVRARLPGRFRALVYFLYRDVLRLGFLDGRAGFAFHVLQGFWYRTWSTPRSPQCGGPCGKGRARGDRAGGEGLRGLALEERALHANRRWIPRPAQPSLAPRVRSACVNKAPERGKRTARR